MPGEGHRPETNFGAGRREPESKIIREAATLAPTNRPSLQYYHPPTRKMRGVIQEAAVVNGASAEAETMAILPDAAAASFGNTMLLEAVIGNDDRARVANQLLAGNPWRQICALRIRAQTGPMFVGTGWFIGAKALATAGHCVFLQNEGGWAEWIDVIPGKYGSAEPFGRMRSEKFACVDGWTKDRSRDCDYGVIFLEDDAVGKKVGSFEVQALSDTELQGIDAKISGYPWDRDRAEYQYFHERPLMSVTSTRLNYDIDTFGGQSGSPIWQDTEERGLVAVGIHTTGGLTSNSGTRISGEVLDNLISWVGGG